MLGKMRLIIHDGLSWIEPARKVIQNNILSRFFQNLFVLDGRQRVQIRHEVKCLISFVLPFEVRTHGSEIISEVQLAGGLHA